MGNTYFDVLEILVEPEWNQHLMLLYQTNTHHKYSHEQNSTIRIKFQIHIFRNLILTFTSLWENMTTALKTHF